MSLKSTLKRLFTGPELQPSPELGRNDRCWCGSGRKYKACHHDRDARRRAAMRAAGPSQGRVGGGF